MSWSAASSTRSARSTRLAVFAMKIHDFHVVLLFPSARGLLRCFYEAVLKGKMEKSSIFRKLSKQTCCWSTSNVPHWSTHARCNLSHDPSSRWRRRNPHFKVPSRSLIQPESGNRSSRPNHVLIIRGALDATVVISVSTRLTVAEGEFLLTL